MPPKDPARRLSSRTVKIGMVSALSLTLVACGSGKTTTAWCVDRQQPGGFTNAKGGYRIVPDWNCDRWDIERGTTGYGRYFWYYGGKRETNSSGGGGAYVYGGRSYGPSKGNIKSGSNGTTLSRGGFGGKSGGS